MNYLLWIWYFIHSTYFYVESDDVFDDFWLPFPNDDEMMLNLGSPFQRNRGGSIGNDEIFSSCYRSGNWNTETTITSSMIIFKTASQMLVYQWGGGEGRGALLFY